MILPADDLSGAAEVAGILWSAGGEVEVQIGREPTPTTGDLVIDTETRGLPPAEAARVVRETCAGLARQGLRLDFKKVDSVLRGPVRADKPRPVDRDDDALPLKRHIMHDRVMSAL